MSPHRREEIDINKSVLDMLMLMAEGNMGAASVISQIMNKYDAGSMCIFTLDDMNIRGVQIWVGYKDACEEDINTFCQRVKQRDPSLVKAINTITSRDPSFKWLAVERGAPSNRNSLRR